ncbi:MAG: hypothetical protein PWP24_956 [Clostridiales bacterium]|nr:hypothetical protein [Clostridiales bacterium]
MREELGQFYQKIRELTYDTLVLEKMIRYIFEGILFLFYMMPRDVLSGTMVIMMGAFLAWTTSYYLKPYTSVMEHGKQVPLSEKLRYLPIKREELLWMQGWELLKYIRKIGILFLLTHLTVSLITGNGIHISTVLFPIGMVFVFVFGSGSAMIYLQSGYSLLAKNHKKG